MTLPLTLDDFTGYCLAKPGVTVDSPMKRDTLWFKVSGKLFAITNSASLVMDGVEVAPFHFINLKCDPDRSLMLRETHVAVRPAWHQNKTHWNSLYLGDELSLDLIQELTDHSYDLAAASLTKKARAELDNA